jgi:hypothetical protein
LKFNQCDIGIGLTNQRSGLSTAEESMKDVAAKLAELVAL